MQEKINSTIAKKKILVIAHSFETGPPQELVKFLNSRALVTAYIDHPFFYSKDTRSSITIYSADAKPVKKYAFKMRGPEFFYYFKDLILSIYFVFRSRHKYDICIACDNLNAFSALMLKKLGRVKYVIYSAVDFTPKRFDNYFLNKFYHFVNRVCCYKSDLIWNSAKGMIKGREETGIFEKFSAPQIVTPDGNNFDQIKRHAVGDINRKDIVFMGHLRKNQGVPMLISAMPEIVKKVPEARLVVVGAGPLEKELKMQVAELKLEEKVVFKGFVDDHADVERILAKCAVAVAPYVPDKESFSYYSDVGKPKAYMACGLPIIITPVPEIAQEVAEKKAGILINFEKKELIDAAVKLLTHDFIYLEYRKNAIFMAQTYKWENIFFRAFQQSFETLKIDDRIRVLVTVPGLLPPATNMAGLRIIYELYKSIAENEQVDIYILTSIFRFIEKDYLKWMEEQKKLYNLKFFIIDDKIYENTIFEFLRSKISFVRKARKLDKTYCFDIIHDYSSAPIIFFFSFFYKVFMKKKVIHTLCTSNKGRLASFKFSGGIRFIDKVLCASRYIANQLKANVGNKYKERISYVSLGLDLDKFKDSFDKTFLRKHIGLSANKKIVLFIGPLGQRKGALVLMEALKLLLEERKDVVFVFVAYGKNGLDKEHEANKKEFLDLISEYKDNVYLLEGSYDIPSLLASTDIFVLPSITSHGILAQPLTLLEAMFMAKPVIASNIDGVEEIIKHGKNGFLFENKNAVDLKDKICDLFDDDDLRLILSREARRDVMANYDVYNSAKKIIDIYDEIFKR